MTTLNAKANAAYHALIDEYEREHPEGVWMGFDHQRDAYEQGWEDGHEAALPTREQIIEALASAEGRTVEGKSDEWRQMAEETFGFRADAVLSLIGGGAA